MPQYGSKVLRSGLITAAIPAMALLVAGCDQGESVAAVNKARNSMAGAAGGAEAAINVDSQNKAFEAAIKSLASQKAEGGIGSAIALINSSAQMGLLGKPGDDAQSALSELSAAESEINGAVAHYRTLASIADASKLDVTARRAELDSEIEKADKTIASQRDKLAGIEKDQGALAGQAGEKRTQAAEFEKQSVTLKERTRTMKAAEAAPILEQALKAKQQCDELRLAASNLEADAGKLEPRKLEAKLAIQELEMKKAALASEKGMLAKRAESAGKGEQEARALVAEAVKTIEKYVGDANKIRDEKLNPAFDAIGTGVSKATSSLGSAKSEPAGKVLAARAAQRKGDLAMARFRELTTWAMTMKTLADAQPPLPQAAKYAAAAKTAQEAAKAAQDDMKQAYTDAKNGFSSVQIKGESQQAARDALVKGLSELAGLPPEGEAAPETPAKPEENAGEGEKKPEGEKAEAPKPEAEKPAEGEKKPDEKKPDPSDGK